MYNFYNNIIIRIIAKIMMAIFNVSDASLESFKNVNDKNRISKIITIDSTKISLLLTFISIMLYNYIKN